MAGVSDNALTKLLGWPQGLDNLSAETDLPIGKRGVGGIVTGALRVAENIDLDDAGKMSRRDGYALVGFTGIHSLYADPKFPLMLAVHGGALVGIDADEVSTTIVSLSAPNLPMSYDFSVGWVFYSNGIDCGRVSSEGVRSEWSLMPPLGIPTLTAHAAGGLYAGTYQVTLTYLDADGRESGTALSEQIEITEGQGILVSDIPQPDDPEVTVARIYASGPNATVMYAVYDVPIGLTQYLVGVHVPGKQLDTEFHEPVPAGHIVRFHNGYHFVAREKVLYWSEALHSGQTHLAKNYLVFNERISMVEGVGQANDAGLFIAAGKRTYYMSGATPKDWKRRIAHPYGAVPRSALQVDQQVLGMEGSGTVPYWLDTSGQFVVGVQGGGVQSLHKERFAAPVEVESAAVVLREVGGMRRILSSLKGGTANGLGITDVAVAEVWKDGVQIE